MVTLIEKTFRGKLWYHIVELAAHILNYKAKLWDETS